MRACMRRTDRIARSHRPGRGHRCRCAARRHRAHTGRSRQGEHTNVDMPVRAGVPQRAGARRVASAAVPDGLADSPVELRAVRLRDADQLNCSRRLPIVGALPRPHDTDLAHEHVRDRDPGHLDIPGPPRSRGQRSALSFPLRAPAVGAPIARERPVGRNPAENAVSCALSPPASRQALRRVARSPRGVRPGREPGVLQGVGSRRADADAPPTDRDDGARDVRPPARRNMHRAARARPPGVRDARSATGPLSRHERSVARAEHQRAHAAPPFARRRDVVSARSRRRALQPSPSTICKTRA